MSEWRDYSAMDRDELERRCRAAEDVAIMYGYTGSPPPERATDREAALFELWRHWRELPGVSLDTRANADLLARVPQLAAQRRAMARALRFAASLAASPSTPEVG